MKIQVAIVNRMNQVFQNDAIHVVVKLNYFWFQDTGQ